MLKYRNLAAELVRNDIDYDKAAKELGITTKTFKAKMEGESDWAWSQVRKIRKMIKTTTDIDYLFSDEPNAGQQSA